MGNQPVPTPVLITLQLSMSCTLAWEGENGAASYYIQGGPAYSAVDAASSSDLEFSGKAGGAVAVSESVSVYGELSLVTAKENGYGAKGGIKYSF